MQRGFGESEAVVIQQMRENLAEPEEKNSDQTAVGHGAIGIMILESSHIERAHNFGGRPSREHRSVDSRHTFGSENIQHECWHGGEPSSKAQEHVADEAAKYPGITPAHAAETPSEKIARLKAQAVSVNDQPNSFTRSDWKKLHA